MQIDVHNQLRDRSSSPLTLDQKLSGNDNWLRLPSTFRSGILISQSDNPTKGAQPVRDKNGKIVGWSIPSPDGKRTPKGLDWGRANGLDPNKFQTAAKIGVIGAIGAAGAYAISTAPEWAPFLVLVP